MKATHRTPAYVLDLKKGLGFLDSLRVDLPPCSRSPDIRYLRRIEKWSVPPSYRTGFAVFAMAMVLSLFSVATFEAQTMANSHRQLLHAQLLQEFSKLTQDFESYRETDADAGRELLVPSNENLSNFSDPLEQQTLLVQLGLEVHKGYEHFQDFLGVWGKSDLNPLEKLRQMNRSAERSLQVWNRIFASLDTFPFYQFDPEARAQLQSSLLLMSELRGFLEGFTGLSPTLVTLLGSEQPQRVLLFVQDPHERRATGGVVSAGVEILLEGGEVLQWKPFHVDELEALKGVIAPPAELSGITDRSSVATANRFLHVPRSAEEVLWYWQRQSRNSADLVAFVNSSLFEQLYGILPSAELEHTSLRWSALRLGDQREDLKHLASSLFLQSGQIMKDPALFLQATSLIWELRDEKQLAFWSPHPSLQKALEGVQLDGALPSPNSREDFLMISSVNQGENASDRWIVENAQLHTAISETGTIKNWLKFDQRHRWEGAFLQPLLEKVGTPMTRELTNQMSSAAQDRLVRILVPRGSVLQSSLGISLSDVSIAQTDAHTVWSFSQRIEAGKSATVELVYELPWSFDTQTVDNYRLQLVKQPGTVPMGFEHLMKLPSSLSVFQALPEEPITELKKDERIAVVAGRNP